jgi:hypothetical protein
MATIERFVTVGPDDSEGDHEFDTLQDAIDAAPDGHAVVMRTYEYDDSELVWTPDGSDTWPPKGRARK